MESLYVCAPVSCERSIPYPKRHSEFEVQAWLYMALREAGYDARGEVKTFFQPKDKKARKKALFCRFDVVVYDEEQKAISVLEVKADKVKHQNGAEGTRQGQRYRVYGVPVTFIYGMEGAEAFVRGLPLTTPDVRTA
jgi:hypothetical protein